MTIEQFQSLTKEEQTKINKKCKAYVRKTFKGRDSFTHTELKEVQIKFLSQVQSTK